MRNPVKGLICNVIFLKNYNSVSDKRQLITDNRKMTRYNFDHLFADEKLVYVEKHCPKVADFLTWTDPIKSITVYAVANFYAELIFDLTERKLEAIIPFDTVDYLAKYRSFMAPVEGQIRGLIHNPNPFGNL
ncbi:hypothetical protein LS48_08605 [Aequorivita aquimaris]|uniref:Uncharacterized protein n=1 Tax=Aequorivita aquimaris TaxID=1548749 RepID=A0A137RHZ4_9FLAO|nr:hypothetical protein [Aequorivita aquimaris]KXN99116.1 hypothetical protein LS48_08605 [Aequorivita aquimaris]